MQRRKGNTPHKHASVGTSGVRTYIGKKATMSVPNGSGTLSKGIGKGSKGIEKGSKGIYWDSMYAFIEVNPSAVHTVEVVTVGVRR
jgi:hypothetical protein